MSSKTKWQFNGHLRSRGTLVAAAEELAEMLERIEKSDCIRSWDEITAVLDKYRVPKEQTVEEAVEEDPARTWLIVARRLDALIAEVRALKEQAT